MGPLAQAFVLRIFLAIRLSSILRAPLEPRHSPLPGYSFHTPRRKVRAWNLAACLSRIRRQDDAKSAFVIPAVRRAACSAR